MRKPALAIVAFSLLGLVACAADTQDEGDDTGPAGTTDEAVSVSCQGSNGSYVGRDCHTACGGDERISQLNQNSKFKTISCKSKSSARTYRVLCCDVS